MYPRLLALLLIFLFTAPSLAQVRPVRPRVPVAPSPTTTSVPTPGISIRVTPRAPDLAPDAPAPVVTGAVIAVPKPEISNPQYRDVPWPLPRPVYVAGIEPPEKRPILSLGRPTLLEAEYRPGEIVVMSRSGDTSDMIAEYDLSLVSKTYIALIDMEISRLRLKEDAEVDEAIELLLADDRVIGAQPNYLFALQQNKETGPDTPTADPFLAELQYAPRQMTVDQVHALSHGENAKIAVIDTGVDMDHNEFMHTMFQSFDAVDQPAARPEPHGTAIAGLISAGHSMEGIAPGAELLTARAFAEDEGRFLSDSYTIARAIDWSVAEGAEIINMSFAGPADPLVLAMMDELTNRDVLVVAAAGNNGPGAPAAYPAAHPHAIAVTATDKSDGLYIHANRGIYITVAAPGVDVIAPAPGNTYDMSSGTSIATAHVTGILALLISRKGKLSRAEIADLFGKTAKDAGAPGPDPEFGLGLVDAYRAAAALELTAETGSEG